MTRATFRQADIERIIRAAAKTGAIVQVDLRSLVVTIIPGTKIAAEPAEPVEQALAKDGEESWDDEDWSFYQRQPSADAPPNPIQPDLDNREYSIMVRLTALGPSARLHTAGTRGFGPVTQKKLLDRGYVEIIKETGEKREDEEVVLTAKGWDDWNAQVAHIKKYGYL